MTRLIPCEFCGKITKLTRTDKKVCSNLCSVKLIYARNHAYQTPYETYNGIIENYNLEPVKEVELNKANNPKTKRKDISSEMLLETEKRIKELNL